MERSLHFRIIGLILFAGLISCQKVINLDLNSPSPQLVVEGSISDDPGPYLVKLSKTVSFNNITSFPEVSGARVEISDSSGNSETLTEVQKGIYAATTIKGLSGESYRLTIETEGQVYESVSYMPYPVENLKLAITVEADVRTPVDANSGQHPPDYHVSYEVRDPEQYKNYYRFVVYHKKRQISSRRIFDDQFHNGKIIAGEIGLHDTIAFVPGDTIVVELQNIDKGTYDFFRTLRDGAGGLTFLSASPSNPVSNISNNGLGYFSAYSVNKGFAVIP